jgi:arsenate reductase
MNHGHDKKRVLFICTNNAACSQMAEGFLRTQYGDRYAAYSAALNLPASIRVRSP